MMIWLWRARGAMICVLLVIIGHTYLQGYNQKLQGKNLLLMSGT
jgi:hypothetical protein